MAYSLLMGILAVYSNLTMLNYYVALIGAINIFILFSKSGSRWKLFLKANTIILVSAVLLTSLIYTPVSKLLERNELYYGGAIGFFQDTLYSLTECFLYSQRYFGEETVNIFYWGTIVLFLASVSYGFVAFYKTKTLEGAPFYNVLLLLMILSNITQYYLLGTKYLIGRTALLYYPIIGISFLFLLNSFPAIFRALFSIPIIWHFLTSANFSTTREWWYDRFTEEVVEYIMNTNHGIDNNDTIRLGGRWIFSPTIKYYKIIRGYDKLIEPTYNQEVSNDTTFDFYYIEGQDIQKLHPDYQLEKDFEGYLLMKRTKSEDSTPNGTLK